MTDIACFRFEKTYLARYSNRFRSLPDFELRVEAKCLRDLNRDILSHKSLESCYRDIHRVSADRHLSESIIPGFRRRGAEDRARFCIFCFNVGAGDNRTCRICNCSRNCSAITLTEKSARAYECECNIPVHTNSHPWQMLPLATERSNIFDPLGGRLFLIY